MQPKHWFVFIFLGIVWSASFLWIKIAVQEIGPFTLATIRVFFGAVVVVGILLSTRTKLPRDFSTWRTYFIISLTSIAVPFVLISWGEQSIDSALAAVLNSTVPLFTIVIAHLFLSDDRLTPRRSLGLLIGFGGVLVLLSRDLFATSHNSVLGQAAILVASIFYAASSVFARRMTREQPGLVRGSLPLILSVAIMGLVTPAVESPLRLPALPITWVALLWLGVLGSGLAQVAFYYLLHEIGPTRAAMVTYLFPLGGMILGIIFLNEQLSWQLAAGAMIIFASLVVVNWKTVRESIGG
ncbi:MAG: EamA family transporter [Chloroflexota bacterium]